jgi:hypothetical protein
MANFFTNSFDEYFPINKQIIRYANDKELAIIHSFDKKVIA